jgi:hypothetical protein
VSPPQAFLDDGLAQNRSVPPGYGEIGLLLRRSSSNMRCMFFVVAPNSSPISLIPKPAS